MQSLKRSLRFRWSSSQMEANLEASDLTATELPPTYLRAFHSLIALDSSSTFLIREACGHFRRPRKKKLQHSESCVAAKKRVPFTGFGYRLLPKFGLKQHALYIS